MKALPVLLAALLTLPGSAQTEADPEAVRALVADLADESWSVRREAAERLAAIGEPARPVLEAAREHEDPEVRGRVLEILRDLDEAPRAHLQGILGARFSDALRTKLGEKPPPVRIPQVPPSYLVRVLEKTSGLKVRLPDDPDLQRTRIEAPVDPSSLGALLDGSFGKAGYVYVEDGDGLLVQRPEDVLEKPATLALLLETLGGDDEELRGWSILLLRSLTRRTFGYPDAADALDRWREYAAPGRLEWNAEEGYFEPTGD